MKRFLSLAVALVFAVLPALTVYAASPADIEALRGTKLYVYNWGEYISDGEDDSLDVNAAFEEKYGIEVVYNTFDNNESMYAKLQGGGVSYDVLIPSDYMVERMINEDMLAKLDFDNIPNYKYIDSKYKGLAYDPDEEYSVPYNVGMVGLIYNTKLVSEPPTSWTALWDEQYKGQVLMFNNPRDAFAIAQSILDLDYNTEYPGDWQAAANQLKLQKNVIQSYVNDEVFNKMESGEAALAPYYAGDFLSMQEINPDLGFVYPEEGVNSFVDAMCIPKNAKNKLSAELYINFMLEPEVALANAEYICYASPNTEVVNNPEYSFYGDEVLYPEKEPRTQIYINLSDESLALMNTLWDEVKNYQAGGDINSKKAAASKYTIYLCVFAAICIIIIAYKAILKKYRSKGID